MSRKQIAFMMALTLATAFMWFTIGVLVCAAGGLSL